MNTKRILELADHLKSIPHDPDPESGTNGEMEELEAFNMSYFHCGSSGCICGWSVFLWPQPGMEPWDPADGAAILDLDHDVAMELFHPHLGAVMSNGSALESVTPQEAAAVLREVARTNPKDDLDVLDIWERVLNEQRATT